MATLFFSTCYLDVFGVLPALKGYFFEPFFFKNVRDQNLAGYLKFAYLRFGNPVLVDFSGKIVSFLGCISNYCCLPQIALVSQEMSKELDERSDLWERKGTKKAPIILLNFCKEGTFAKP